MRKRNNQQKDKSEKGKTGKDTFEMEPLENVNSEKDNSEQF